MWNNESNVIVYILYTHEPDVSQVRDVTNVGMKGIEWERKGEDKQDYFSIFFHCHRN